MCQFCPIDVTTSEFYKGLVKAKAALRAFAEAMPKSKKKRRGKKWKGVSRHVLP